MPPKRKPPTKATSTSTTNAPPPAKRRSKLAKENSITADQEAEIQEAFALFSRKASDTQATAADAVIATSDLRRCLIALDCAPRTPHDLAELVSAADPEDEGWISYEHFVSVAALQLERHQRERDDDDDDDNNNDGAVNAEVVGAYCLFTKGEADRPITLFDLKRVAKELREDVPDAVLKDMIREATGGGLGGVSMEEFEGVMRRAGVFG